MDGIFLNLEEDEDEEFKCIDYEMDHIIKMNKFFDLFVSSVKRKLNTRKCIDYIIKNADINFIMYPLILTELYCEYARNLGGDKDYKDKIFKIMDKNYSKDTCKDILLKLSPFFEYIKKRTEI